MGVQHLLSGLPGGKLDKFEDVKQVLTAHFQPKRKKYRLVQVQMI